MSLFPQSFRHFIVLLQKHKVEFVIVGGFAVNLYGYARSTGDIDILINRNSNNFNKLIKAVHEFGYNTEPLKKKTIGKELVFFHLGTPPERIDILSKVIGLEFKDIYSRCQWFELDDLTIPVISLEDLKFTKSLMPRNKDLNDLDNLQ